MKRSFILVLAMVAGLAGLAIGLAASRSESPRTIKAVRAVAHSASSASASVAASGAKATESADEPHVVRFAAHPQPMPAFLVNDLDGNPIEIAAVVVWQVVDSAEAVFEVDNYENFVQVQSESALRNMATSYAYDSHVAGQMSLRSHTAETAVQLKKEIEDRLAKAGVDVIEARISHLAYAAEIAGAMLQRQQASAIVAARTTIVEGAVSIVEMALDQLSQRKVVELDPERRAAMVSNLLVVLCGERSPQPVVNAGTLYSG